MANILKNLKLTSVDLVRAGANQEADICLFKSKEGKKVHKMTINLDVLPENERDTLQTLLAKAAVQEGAGSSEDAAGGSVEKMDPSYTGSGYEPPALLEGLLPRWLRGLATQSADWGLSPADVPTRWTPPLPFGGPPPLSRQCHQLKRLSKNFRCKSAIKLTI